MAIELGTCEGATALPGGRSRVALSLSTNPARGTGCADYIDRIDENTDFHHIECLSNGVSAKGNMGEWIEENIVSGRETDFSISFGIP